MPSWSNKKQVQSFMFNYLAKFSPRLSELAEPIRELTKDRVPFNWGPEDQQAFVQIKKEIASVPILPYYNPKKQTTLQTDASIKGLGACLLHDSKPMYFASKALTNAQKGYVVIELESFAVAWAMEKFHHFLYASHSLLETNQRLLEAILSKGFNPATPRLQRILIRTFAYNFTFEYITEILKPLVSKFPHHINSTQDFVEQIKHVTLLPEECLGSNDVSVLFISVPVDPALGIMKDLLEKDPTLRERTVMSVGHIALLLEFCLKNTYFSFQDQFYEQVEGVAMGMPESPIAANLYMKEYFEEKALSTASQPQFMVPVCG